MTATRLLGPLFTGLVLAGPAAAEPVTPTADAPAATGWKVTTVTGGLEHPWAIAWLPDGSALITERPGRLRVLRDGKLFDQPVTGVPTVAAVGQGGLLDVALHPKFAENKLVYFTYSAGTPQANATTLARARFTGTGLEDVQTLFQTPQKKSGGQHFGSRILFLPDGTLLLSVGDGGNPPVKFDGDFIRKQAQNKLAGLGKVHRLDENGQPPKDNPFFSEGGPAATIFTFGHRNIQALARDPDTGRLWATEHGARGGDELNLLQPGHNYGWPLVTFSKEYFGPDISDKTHDDAFDDPIVAWTPCIAPSGMLVYTGSQFPRWKGALLCGGLLTKEIRIVYLDGAKAARQESIKLPSRVRDVRLGPDGHLYVLTDEDQGELLRLEPA